MKNMTIREVPDDVYAVICREAKENHRSIQDQVRHILAKEARLRHGGMLKAMHRWRERTAGRDLGDTVTDIRKARNRK